MIILKDYQDKAVNELVEYTKKIFGRREFGDIIVLQSPTGSGKTVIAAKFIETIIKELLNEQLCFIWLSIGKGELHIQSKNKLDKVFGGFPKVSFVEGEFIGSKDSIERNEVVVVNWEKLRNKNQEGEWKNKLMRDGERINFREVLINTSKKLKIIVLIDESHVSVETDRARELLDYINADTVLEMSATPNLKKESSFKWDVDPKDVIESGMIKKSLIINKDFDLIKDSKLDSQTLVLNEAYKKRLYLKSLYEIEGSNVNPLCLIQIPMSEVGEEKIKIIQEFLYSKEITETNGKLAIWLSDRKSEDLDQISKPDNKIEFLIFKQAVNTGWDCPRAQILTKLREPTNGAFEIQTVGRILRMPEQHHYDNEDMNIGYIYTDSDRIIINPYKYYPEMIKDKSSTRIPEYINIDLIAYHKKREVRGELGYDYRQILFKVICDYYEITSYNFDQNKKLLELKGIVFNIDNIDNKILTNHKIESTTIDSPDAKYDATYLDSFINDGMLQGMVETEIRKNIGEISLFKRSVPIIKQSLIEFFKLYLGIDSLLDIYKIFIHNKVRFDRMLIESAKAYNVYKKSDLAKELLDIDEYYRYNISVKTHYCGVSVREQPFIIKCVYKPYYRAILPPPHGNSISENELEEYVDKIDSVKWWWKNGKTGKESFGIKYEYNDEVHTFYPDYLMQLSNGIVGLFEVKDSHDRDGLTYTKMKAECLQKYIYHQNKNDGKNLIGGIVINVNGLWMIHNGEIYDWTKCEKDDWSEWKEFESVIKCKNSPLK